MLLGAWQDPAREEAQALWDAVRAREAMAAEADFTYVQCLHYGPVKVLKSVACCPGDT